ncbi:MAG: CotH kinase family protein [Bacteroidota bacterium]|nr:CotH kinase family protein [Bacteroidota bacterium]
MNTPFRYIFALSLFLLWSQHLDAQVVINEYSCSNMNTITDNYSENEDWIELYNTGTSTVSLAGFHLSDRATNPTKWQIPASVSLGPNDFLMVFASKRNEYSGGYLHTSFKLTQTKLEHIVLADPSGNIIDVVQTIPAQKDHSRGRTTNGASTWALFTNPTPNANNTGAKENYAFIPQFDIAPGLYSTAFSLNITSPDAGVTIYYTTDGSEPLTTSSTVTGPITISITTVVRARAFSSNPDIPTSFIETNTYFVSDEHTLPIVSVSGDQVDDLLNGNQGNYEGAFEYFGADQVFIDESTGHFNKHGNDSWAYAQRGFDYISRDQFGFSHAIEHQIFRDSDRDEYQRLILKAAANDNYPFQNGGAHIRDAYVHSFSLLANLELDERTYEPCIVYLNGEYWGVYDIREKADDHDYTDYYYDQDKFDIQYLKTWGGTWTEYGAPDADPAWQELKNFIIGNDMSVEANYLHVDSFYNYLSLIDYVVLNSYIVCSDWLNWNTAWWRGMDPDGEARKWRYVLWDEDATFGHYINYTGIPDVTTGADPCNPETLGDPGGQGHIPVLNALLNNETFSQLYISRFIDLSNTVFSCDYMQYLLDSLIDNIQPEMQGQITKWGGTYTEWESNVQELKDFIDGRCVDLTQGMIDCYDLTGPFDIMVKVEPIGSGEIKINSLWFDQFPYFGTYYGDIDVLLEAKPNNDYIFSHWEFLHNTVNPGNNLSEVALNLISTDTIVAVFIHPAPSVNLGNDTAICQGTSITLNAGNPDYSHTWHDGSQQQTFIVNEAGTYSVTVTNLDYTDIDMIEISIITMPWINLEEDLQICPNQTISLHAQSDADSVIWQDNTIGNIYQASAPGIYWAQAQNICGLVSDSIELFDGIAPDFNLGSDFDIEMGQSVMLNASAYEATYQWHDNSTDAFFEVTEPGNYWVIVTNSCGSSFDEINVDCDCEVIIPNAFSPNGDGINDEFIITGKGIIPESFKLMIYDRWGKLVFESNNLYKHWDGKINGNSISNSGVYNYILSYTKFDGKKVWKNGNILVLL